ncbi:Synaptotagmin-like protein 1 [Nibea albiflora]|uniref:Synaptotagmin-like protein 1 n=1 Tax=Nibea albiflora TaxID=240163 RepID=A0ACB7EU32_NIBAL|nr:Synaptotagmin-like protein 1 [Nibea albiflora]
MEEKQADSYLDLSHLTEDEQTTILQVLQRDLELRRLDEGRVRNLQEKEKDPVRLRYLSGEWFREQCSKRHHTWSASTLVHATIRHRKTKTRDLPLTGLFNGETEETSHNNNTSPEAERRLKDSKDDESGWSEGNLKPTPAPRRKNPIEQLSGSMMSLFSSGDFGLVEVRGRIQFSLVYDTQKEELHVKVYCCEDIAAARKNRSDPYVKAYLLPDKSSQSKKKTSVKKKTLNPVYDQTLRYKLHIGELRSRTLNMSVWHAEPLGRNVFLGEVEVSLGLWDWTYTQPLWQDLQPRVHLSPESISCRGTIVLSIKFIPDGFEGGGLPLTGELHIWLREAKGLLSTKGGSIDSFVRSYILPDASRQSGQKTRTMKRSISPTYNHTMVYDGFHTSDLREACAELTVWHREGLKSHKLGGIRLSSGTGQSYGEAVTWMDSTEEEVAVWTSMIENPNHWIDTALPIRTNLAHRKLIQTLAETLSKEVEHFNKTEVECLIREFNVLLGEPTIPGRAAHGLDRAAFRTILHNMFGMTDDMIMDGVFRTFDKDKDSFISMREWIEGLSVFLRGTLDEKIKYCFDVYDLNGDRYISREEMIPMLKNSLIRQPTEEDPDEGLKDLVEITLKKMDYDHDGRISSDDFERAVREENLLLEAFGTCLPDMKSIEAFDQNVFQKQLEQ